MTWQLAHDLLANLGSASPTNPFADSSGNPGVWHMMFSSGLSYDPKTFGDIPTWDLNLDFACGARAPGYSCWLFEDSAGALAQAGMNTSSATLSGYTCAPYQVIKPYTAVVHPGPANLVLFGWQSPIAGTVSVGASFVDDDCGGGDGIEWLVELAQAGNVVLMGSGAFANCGQSTTQFETTMTVGDYLYFIVNPKGDYGYDLTEVDVAVTCK